MTKVSFPRSRFYLEYGEMTVVNLKYVRLVRHFDKLNEQVDYPAHDTCFSRMSMALSLK